jgi:hypothetical protein
MTSQLRTPTATEAALANFDVALKERRGEQVAPEQRDTALSFGSSPTYRRMRRVIVAAHRQLRRPAPPPRATRPRGHSPRPQRRVSRRESRASGDDPGGGDEPPERLCLGCDQPLVDRAPQARFHDEACRARHRRRLAEEAASAAPTISDEQALSIWRADQEFAHLRRLMQQTPCGLPPSQLAAVMA